MEKISELPKVYDAGKIDISTVRLNYTIPAENNPKYGFVKNPEIADRDGNGIPELMVKFDRSAVQKMVGQAAGTVELVVTGEVADNSGVPIPFNGSDAVKIVK